MYYFLYRNSSYNILTYYNKVNYFKFILKSLSDIIKVLKSSNYKIVKIIIIIQGVISSIFFKPIIKFPYVIASKYADRFQEGSGLRDGRGAEGRAKLTTQND